MSVALVANSSLSVMISQFQLMEEAHRCPRPGVVWGLTSGNSIGCPPILNFGTESQRQAYLPRVYRGEIRFCLGITEPEGMEPFFTSSGSPLTVIFVR